MIEERLRKHYQVLLVDPLVNAAWMQNQSPNKITIIGCMAGLLAALFIPLGLSWLSCIALWLSGYLDTVDGSLARQLNRSSPVGSAIDIVSDRMVEFAIILGLYSVDPQGRGLVALLMLGSILICVTTFLVVGIFSKEDTEKSFYYSPGLMERAEAFIGFTLLILFPAYFSVIGYLFAVLVFLTAYIRMKQFIAF